MSLLYHVDSSQIAKSTRHRVIYFAGKKDRIQSEHIK